MPNFVKPQDSIESPEDRTFNALRRSSYETVRKAIGENYREENVRHVLKNHGWKMTEYWAEIDGRSGRKNI